MKNPILFLILAITASSCCTDQDSKSRLDQKIADYKVANAIQNVQLIDLTFDNETHQYVLYNAPERKGSLSHWAGCKYCRTSEPCN